MTPRPLRCRKISPIRIPARPGGEQEVREMPTPPKALENMSKNLTEEERQLRERAGGGRDP